MIGLKSKITREIAGYFFFHEEEALYVNELVRRLNVDKRNLVKKLGELTEIGLFKTENKGNLKIYSLDKNFPLYAEYKRIFLSTIGMEARLKKLFKSVNGIERAFIYGSYAENKMDSMSDIDIFAVGSHKIIDLQKKMGELQKKYDREINLISISRSELNKKKNDPFISEIMKRKKIELV